MKWTKTTITIITLMLFATVSWGKGPTAKALDVLDPQRITKTVGIHVVERTVNPDNSLTLRYRWYDRRLDRDLERSVIINEDTVIGIGGELKQLSDLTEEVLQAPSVATVGDDRKTAVMLRIGRDKIRISEDQLTPKQIEQMRSLVAPLTEASQKSLEETVTGIVAMLELNDPATESRLCDIIRTQRLSVITNHNAGLAPPKDARDNLNKGLNEILTPEQIDKVKNALTQNQMIRIFIVYHQIVPQLTAEHDQVILDLLRQGREAALDIKKPRDVVAAFSPYKTQIETYITAQGYDWKEYYRAFVKARNEAQ